MKKTFYIFILLFALSFSCVAQNNSDIMEQFTQIGWRGLDENIIRLIGHDWMLVTAGTPEQGFNMMTASWGGMGWLWEKPVAFVFVRPQRYTHEFTEREDFMTLTFYAEEYRQILNKMGTVSGRNFDKMKQSGLTPFKTENGSVAFAEARIIVECRKLYSTVIQENAFHDKAVVSSKYPQKDFHTMYICEIVNVWKKK
jgi:flavin reductase (DIM6/NTAB) family NADH-FMN oxidoreductase RutF